jgi:hypothetical protein
MEENRPSIDAIVSQWSDEYGNRFSTKIRREAMRVLIQTLVRYGYSRSSVESAKSQVLKYCVGKRSPHGSLNEWKSKVLDDWRRTILEMFEPIELASEQIDIPFTPVHKTEEELAEEAKSVEAFEQVPQFEETEPQETQDSDIQESGEFKYQFKPPLDLSIFPDVETTPIMSDDEFLASLEREDQ